jgi:hypothetical protein
MAITIGQAMRDIYGDNIRATNNTANTTNKSTLPVKQSTVSQPKTSTKTTGAINLASAFNDIYGDDTAYDTYVSNKTMYQPAVTDDENLQKKQGFWKNLFQTSEYYKDGYDRGDFLRTVGDTGKSALSSIAEGFLNTVEGIADWGQYRVSDVLDFFGATNAAQSVKENAQFNSTASIFGKNTTGGDLFESGWKENIDKGSVLGRSGQQIFEGIGNVAALAGSAYLGGQAIGGVAPAATTTTFGQSTLAEIGASSVGSYVSAYGSARSNALNQGYSDADAKKAAVVSGLAEAISEQFFNGMTGLHTAGLGETVFGKVVPKTVTESMQKFFSTKAGKVVSVILDGVEEGSEEIISNILTATGNDIAHLIDPNYSANGMDEQTGNWWKDVRAQLVSSESWDAFFSAMMTSALLGGANTMINEDNKPLLNSKQRQELIQAYAEDNNMSVEEAKGRLDLQESVQGQNEQTVERTVYSNVDTNMAIEEINKIDNLKDIEDLISQLQEDLTQDRDTRAMTREDLAPIAEKLNAARKHQQELIEQMNAVEKADTLNNSLDEISNIVEETSNTMNDITSTPQASPEVLVAKDEVANDIAKSIDEDTTIPVAENKKEVSVDYNQVEEAAIEYINQLNAEREAQGQPRITIIQNLNQEQIRIADALMALGRHVMFAKDLPGSFVTPTNTNNAQLNQVLYISDKINTGLLAKSSVTNKNQAMTYAIGHELFHSLRMNEPGVYNNFVEYVANTINDDQIVRFMEMYDPQDSQNLLKDLQIDGQFNLGEVLTNPKKYASQYQALLSIAEEMTANEFGGMLTDVEYMTNLANQNKSLFKKVVNAIKKFFKDLDKPIYNSTLTQYQINTIRQNFEDIAKTAGESLITKNATNSLSTTQGLINEINATNKNVANSQETVYNTPQKEEGYNEFERLQKESEGLSNEEKQLYRSGSRQIDEDLRRRFSRVFGQKLESSRSGNSNESRVLTDPRSGNKFDVYENVDAQTFHDVFDIVRNYTQYGELVDVHPIVSTEDDIGYDSTQNYMTKDGLSGFAITKDGDLISVYNASDKRGWLRAISDIVKEKAKTLDCFMSPNQPLSQIYQDIFGFKVASIMDHNMEYDHDDIAKNHNKPKVAFMVNTDQDVQTRSFGKDDYSEAKAYQMSFLDENAGKQTTFADVATAYNDANSGKIPVEDARAVYNKYLDEGGKQDVDIETALDGLENSVKKPKPTRQKLEKVTQQVNTSEQVEKPARQKLPTKQTRTPNYIEHFDENMREGRSDAYLVFEDTISDDKLTGKNIETLREHALEAAKDEETKDLIRNWTPEIMEQERAEIKATEQTQKDIVKENDNKIKLNDKYYEAKEAYESLLESGLDGFRTKARELYKEYKDAGGKRIIEGLEEQQKPSLPKKEAVTPQEEVKTFTMSLEDRWNAVLKSYERYKSSPKTKQDMLRNGLVRSYNAYKNAGGTEVLADVESMSKEIEGLTQEQLENKTRDLFKDMMLSRGTINDDGTIRFIPNIEANTPKGKKISKFFSNTITNSPFAQNIINVLGTNTDITYYTPITNEDTLRKAMDDIAEKGEDSVYEFLGKEHLDAVDVGKAVLLTNYYKLTGDLAKQQMIWTKLSGQGTKAGQFIQALSMLKYMSPEAIANGFQSDLTYALEKMQDSRDPAISRWIQDQMNIDQLTLTDAERTWIMEMVDKASKLDPDSHEYKVKMAQVYAYIANKIPKSIMNKLKTFRRLSMLANAKTQLRNTVGNFGALPVNIGADFFGSRLDKWLSKYTNTRTQGTFRFKEGFEGAKQGYREALQDKRLGINTQNINAYEFQTGQTFNNKKLSGRILNKIEQWTNFGLDLGDRPFEHGYYNSALANIMALNGHEFATELDKRLAQEEAEEKVWKNKGKMAELAISTRNTLNKVHVGELGLGDLILPFVLTPANLAAATYKYSPAAVLSVAKNAREFKNTIKTGAKYEQQVLAQKKLVDSFGKMTAGTVLYAIAYAISKAGNITGGEDDDKEVASMMNSLGWQKYSVKIGDKYYSYDWAEPFANPFAVMAEIQRQQQDGKFENNSELTNALQVLAEAFKIGGTRLQDQSFLSSLQSIFSGQDSIADGFIDFAAGLPASFVPTAAKQLADIMDGSAKMTYDKNSVWKTALNKMLVKIPGAKSLLPTKKTTLGNEARKYQEVENIGNLLGNIFNSTTSPANVSIDTSGEIGEEFIDVYNHTGDATIMPQIAVKSLNYGSEKYQFTLPQQSALQTAMGDIVTKGMNELLMNDVYNTASYTDKATALTSLVQYAKGKALEQSGYVPNYEIKSGNASQINKYVNSGLSIGEAVMYDSLINPIKGEKDSNGDTIAGSQNGAKAYTIMNMAIPDKSKDVMLQLISPTSKTPETVNSLGNFNTKEEFQSYYSLSRHDAFVNEKFSRDDIDLATKYFNFDVGNFAKYATDLSDIRSDKDANGNTIENSKKRKVINYLDSLPINPIQKTYLLGLSGYSLKPYASELRAYINNLNISPEEKQQLWTQLGFK